MKCPECGLSNLRYDGYKKVDVWVTPHTKMRFAHSYRCRNLRCQALVVRWHGRYVTIRERVA